ncbi:MAG: hypothetical protein SFW66_09060 [Gammaproteobacteria bacterium]|nr:hypothetical protein [Gammaproteobacteria bacterium]
METKKSTAEELAGLTGDQLLFRMDELRHAAADAGYRWAEADKKYKDLKEMMPSLLATIQLSFKTEKMNLAEAKTRALASTTYQERLKEMNLAEYEAELIRVEYRGFMESLKSIQAIAFVKNSELKLAR